MVFQDADSDPITFWPGVYGAEGDDNTWNSLVAAIADGAVCRGTWIARPGKIGCHPLGPWNEQFIRPKSLPSSVPLLVWQGVQECQNIDYNRANPAVSTDLMSGLVLPPSLSDWLGDGRRCELVAILAPLLRVCSGIAAVQHPATANLSVIGERYWITRCSVWNGGEKCRL